MKHQTFYHEASVLKALAHRKRLEIVHLLYGRELTATEIQKMTGFPQANMSQHLKLLKSAQVVVAVRSGRQIRYRLSHPNFWRIGQMLQETSATCPARKRESKKTQIKDPVCGMWVAPAATRFKTIYKGATYFFCASGCQHHFEKAPEKYVRH